MRGFTKVRLVSPPTAHRPKEPRVLWVGLSTTVYVDRRDWWIGYYRGERYHFVCPLPCLVIRWERRRR